MNDIEVSVFCVCVFRLEICEKLKKDPHSAAAGKKEREKLDEDIAAGLRMVQVLCCVIHDNLLKRLPC